MALTLLVSVRPVRNSANETVLCLISFRDVARQQPVVAISNVTSSLADAEAATNINGMLM